MKTFVGILFLFTFCCCRSSDRTSQLRLSDEFAADSKPGQSPYLTSDHRGRTVLSWIRMPEDSGRAFCYAYLTGQNTLGKPVAVPGSQALQPHGENLPKIIFKPSGEIIALWGTASAGAANKYAGRVFYTQSFNDGNTWTAPQPLVRDSTGYDQRYYDVAVLPDGEAGIIWLDNRKTIPGKGSALYFASTRGRNGFGQETLISQPSCECCRTDLFTDSKGIIHALYRGIIDDSIRDMVHVRSTNGGRSFSAPVRISRDNWVINGCPHTGPAMVENESGLHFSWFTGGDKAGCFYKRSYSADTYAQRDGVSAFGSHPQVAALSPGEIAIVWDEFPGNKELPFRRIGIQRRGATGESLEKTFITGDRSHATYPVVAPLGNRKLLVSYTIRRNGVSYVASREIAFGK